jgi:hypothetical protein
VPANIRLPEVINLHAWRTLLFGLDGKAANDTGQLEQDIFDAETELLAA